ncbi:MAG: alpha/beta hydrolase-fold protein [Woeseiaceae bacterium]|nr:alpha/beta hydrolase-fold protein [Woeseiaceae bacterium]
MNAALRKLLRKGPPPQADIDAFVRESTFPLVDEDDITFVYRGEADEIYLRCWIAGLDTAQPFQNLPGTDLWATTIDLPAGSRIEYKFEVVRNGHRHLLLDPLNGVQAHDPFGANSVCQAWGYERPRWTQHDEESRPGRLEKRRIDSPALGGEREITVYTPARFRSNRRYSLLVVHDGVDYLQYASLGIVLDNLIHALEIPPLVVAMIQSPDRLREYAGDERHANFVAEELLPYMSENYPLIDDPTARCLMGASFGGVASLHAAWRHQGVFGNLLLQSGSFAFSDLGRHRRGPVFDPVVKFMNAFREEPGCPAERIFMSCGIYESLIYENRSMVPKLQAQNIEVRFEEARDAHNWENWRDRLRTGLSWVFPGPLWLVYE